MSASINAKVADACGLKGVKAESMEALTEALRTAIKEQMEDGVTTFIEVVLNQELGEPFRRDAMKTPVKVAGIAKDDMRPQPPRDLTQVGANLPPPGPTVCAADLGPGG